MSSWENGEPKPSYSKVSEKGEPKPSKLSRLKPKYSASSGKPSASPRRPKDRKRQKTEQRVDTKDKDAPKTEKKGPETGNEAQGTDKSERCSSVLTGSYEDISSDDEISRELEIVGLENIR